MGELIILKCGELILKGNNRSHFEDKLISNIKICLKNAGKYEIWKAQGAVYVKFESGNTDENIEILKRVFGITNISPAYIAKKDLDDIAQVCFGKLKNVLKSVKTFKVAAKRSDKKFPYKSPEIAYEIGGAILNAFDNLSVDVHNPDVTVNIDIREDNAYIYSERIKGAGGMPTGTNGRGMLLLSGGIDSPVAGWLMAKRGIQLDCINFFSYPYTSERAKEKVIELAKIIGSYCGRIRLHIVPFTNIQLQIKEKCREDQMIIIMRRFMTKIAERIAIENNSSVIITGESLGQVASQTMQSLVVTNEVATIPVLRPLIGLDKEEIITYARRIGTFETSILPYEDCCTIFVPKHPKTKPQLKKIEKSEENLDIESLINEAIENVEIIEI